MSRCAALRLYEKPSSSTEGVPSQSRPGGERRKTVVQIGSEHQSPGIISFWLNHAGVSIARTPSVSRTRKGKIRFGNYFRCEGARMNDFWQRIPRWRWRQMNLRSMQIQNDCRSRDSASVTWQVMCPHCFFRTVTESQSVMQSLITPNILNVIRNRNMHIWTNFQVVITDFVTSLTRVFPKIIGDFSVVKRACTVQIL